MSSEDKEITEVSLGSHWGLTGVSLGSPGGSLGLRWGLAGVTLVSTFRWGPTWGPGRGPANGWGPCALMATPKVRRAALLGVGLTSGGGPDPVLCFAGMVGGDGHG